MSTNTSVHAGQGVKLRFVAENPGSSIYLIKVGTSDGAAEVTFFVSSKWEYESLVNRMRLDERDYASGVLRDYAPPTTWEERRQQRQQKLAESRQKMVEVCAKLVPISDDYL